MTRTTTARWLAWRNTRTQRPSPTDILSFRAVEQGADREGAARALAAFLSVPQDGPVALQRGMLAPVWQAPDIYEAVRPFGFAVYGQDLGRVGPTFRP